MTLIWKLLFFVSFFFNLALYFGWMDLGQYRNTVDQAIEDSKEIWNSEEFQALRSNIAEKLESYYKENLASVTSEIRDNIQEYGEEKAKEIASEQFNQLTSQDVDVLIEEAKKEISGTSNSQPIE